MHIYRYNYSIMIRENRWTSSRIAQKKLIYRVIRTSLYLYGRIITLSHEDSGDG